MGAPDRGKGHRKGWGHSGTQREGAQVGIGDRGRGGKRLGEVLSEAVWHGGEVRDVAVDPGGDRAGSMMDPVTPGARKAWWRAMMRRRKNVSVMGDPNMGNVMEGAVCGDIVKGGLGGVGTTEGVGEQEVYPGLVKYCCYGVKKKKSKRI